MSTARDYLAAVQQRADAATRNREMYASGSRSRRITQEESATDVPRLVAALTAALNLADLHDETERYSGQPWGDVPVHDLRAVITDALTPKENDGRHPGNQWWEADS